MNITAFFLIVCLVLRSFFDISIILLQIGGNKPDLHEKI